jgi:hypothetical protein
MNPAVRYFSGKRRSYGRRLLSSDWGEFSFYIEIVDQHVSRQLNQFENGNLLRYDRDHWCDDFGFMFVGTYSRKQKAGRGMTPISSDEFERIWKRSLAESLWKEQQAHAKMHKWGIWAERVCES